MTISSTAMDNKGHLLPQYTCDGANVSPPLTFSELPSKTQSLALIMDDPDAPNGIFTHWLLYDMSPGTLQLLEGTPPQPGVAGTNDFGKLGYGGACPPSGTHRYFFTLYALDSLLNIPEGASKAEVQQAMEGHIVETAELIGLYGRQGA